jgi:hypothetical protein
MQLQRDGNHEIALFHADSAPHVGDVLECDSFDEFDGEQFAQHGVHYVVQRRPAIDFAGQELVGEVDSVLSLDAGTTVTVRSPAPVDE